MQGETLTITMESECNGMAIHHIDGSGNMECSGYGHEFIIELEGTTWNSGAGRTGCAE